MQLEQLREDLLDNQHEKRRLASELKHEVEAKERAMQRAEECEESIEALKSREEKLQDALIEIRKSPKHDHHSIIGNGGRANHAFSSVRHHLITRRSPELEVEKLLSRLHRIVILSKICS